MIKFNLLKSTFQYLFYYLRGETWIINHENKNYKFYIFTMSLSIIIDMFD